MFFILMMQPIFLGMVLWNLLGALGILWLLNPNILPHLRSLPSPAFMLLATLTCMSATAQSFALVTIATDLRRKYVTKKR